MSADRHDFNDRAEQVALIILGAGRSLRFGKMDKLAVEVGGMPLSHHVLNTTRAFKWSSKTLVHRGSPVWTREYAEAEFTLACNDHPEQGMLGSIKTGLRALKDETHVLICLADMPFVTARHFARLLCQMTNAGTRPVATSAKDYRGPPAIFSVAALNQLPDSGEGGARALLGHALCVDCTHDELFDIDTEQDLKIAASLGWSSP